jgi:hypothetical protein
MYRIVNVLLIHLRHKPIDLIEMHVKNYGRRTWIGFIRLRIWYTSRMAMNMPVPYRAGNFLTARTTIRFLIRTLIYY